MDFTGMSTTTTADTLKALRNMFAQHGLPEQMVSDNGQMSSQHLQRRMESGISVVLRTTQPLMGWQNVLCRHSNGQ